MLWFRKTIVEEAGAVLGPSDGGEPRPFDSIAQHLARVDVQDVYGAPIRASILHRISQKRAIFGRRPFGKCSRPIFCPGVRVNQHAFCVIHAVANIKNALVLLAGSTIIEITAPLSDRNGEPLIGAQPFQPCFEDVPTGQSGKIGSGDLVLRFDPSGNLLVCANIVF